MTTSYRRKWWSLPASILGAVAAFAAMLFAAIGFFVITFAIAESLEQEYASGEELAYATSSSFEPSIWVVGMCYVLSGVVGVLAAIRTFRFLRMEIVHRIDGRFCFKCEYNLTGIESGVCPECETTVLVGNASCDDEMGAP